MTDTDKSVLVSVVMAEYNTPLEYLRESIASVLNQTYKDFEFIIVDDCGNNNLSKVVAEFDDCRIRIMKNQKNMGLVYSLNNGIKQARGKYIVRMDTDDLATPNRIETLYNFISKNPEYDVVGSRVLEFSDNQDIGLLGKGGEKNAKDILRGDVPIHPSVIINKKTYSEVGYYDNYKRAEDFALWCKMILYKKRIYILSDILLRYRVNPEDYTKRRLRHRKGEIKARLKYYPKLNAGPLDYIRIVKSVIAGLAPLWAIRFYRNKFILNKD